MRAQQKPRRVDAKHPPAGSAPAVSNAENGAAKSAPVFQVELRRVGDLVPYERNPRLHSDEQVAQIERLIVEFGWTNPILHDDRIRAGHGRRLAAMSIYAKGGTIRLPNGETIPQGTVPVIDCSGWSEAQKRAYVIADNRSAENATWDHGALRLEMGDLKLADFDLALTAFDPVSVAWLTGGTVVDDPRGEWQGMPSYTHQDKTAFRSLALHFRSQEDVDAFADLVKQKITDQTRFLWYPEIEIERYSDKRYVADAEPAPGSSPPADEPL